MESELVQLLTRMFPSFRGIAPDEALRRAEALGMFAARAWSAGPQAMQARGIPLPPEVHAGLAPVAPRVAQAGQGGAKFLAHLRQGLREDARFAQVMAGIAKVYAESLRGAAPAAAAAPPARPPAPTPAPAPQPADDGGLDLMPEEPTRRRTMTPLGVDLDLAPAPAPAAAAPPQAYAPPSDTGLVPADDALDLAEEDGVGRISSRMSVEDLLYAGESPEEAAVQNDGTAPDDPADRAFWSYERTGDTRYLDQAQQVLVQQQQQAPHPMAAAMAEANLGKVALLRGDGATAQKLAQGALAKYPSNPYAVEVLVRAGRGEAEQTAFTRGLLQLRFALQQRHVAQIRQLADAMRADYPDEPFPYLALAMVARMAGEDSEFEAQVREAWRRYPSQEHADRTFGGDVDVDIANMLNLYGRKAYKKMEEDGLRQTVEEIDSKDNLIAGSLRMAVGLSKVALTAPNVSRSIQRRLHIGAGLGLMGLQYFELAPLEMGKALMLGPSPEEHKQVSNERIQCQALWRAFDKPGIKAQQKKYVCLGARGMADTIRRRVERVREDRSAKERELYDQGPQLWERIRQDPTMKREIAAACEQNTIGNPVLELEAIEEELEGLAKAREGAAAAPKPAKGGLFGKLKSAASSVGSAAKGAAMKVKEGQLSTKRDNAIRQLAVVLARDLNDYAYTNPILVGFSRRAQMLEAFLDYFKAEETRCQDGLNALAFSK